MIIEFENGSRIETITITENKRGSRAEIIIFAEEDDDGNLKCNGCPYYEVGLSGEWCDKVGGKIAWYGHCGEDCDDVEVIPRRSNRKKRDKQEREFRYKLHLQQLSDCHNKRRYGPSAAFPADENGNYVDSSEEGKVSYIKKNYKTRGKISKYLKRFSARKIRRYKGELKSGWSCHKLYDFWWEIY